MLKSLMAYVNGLLSALLILALSSKTSGNLICHDLINFVTDGQYLYIRVFYLVSLQIDAYFGTQFPLKVFFNKYSSSQSLFQLY